MDRHSLVVARIVVHLIRPILCAIRLFYVFQSLFFMRKRLFIIIVAFYYYAFNAPFYTNWPSISIQ